MPLSEIDLFVKHLVKYEDSFLETNMKLRHIDNMLINYSGEEISFR